MNVREKNKLEDNGASTDGQAVAAGSCPVDTLFPSSRDQKKLGNATVFENHSIKSQNIIFLGFELFNLGGN